MNPLYEGAECPYSRHQLRKLQKRELKESAHSIELETLFDDAPEHDELQIQSVFSCNYRALKRAGRVYAEFHNTEDHKTISELSQLIDGDERLKDQMVGDFRSVEGLNVFDEQDIIVVRHKTPSSIPYAERTTSVANDPQLLPYLCAYFILQERTVKRFKSTPAPKLEHPMAYFGVARQISFQDELVVPNHTSVGEHIQDITDTTHLSFSFSEGMLSVAFACSLFPEIMEAKDENDFAKRVTLITAALPEEGILAPLTRRGVQIRNAILTKEDGAQPTLNPALRKHFAAKRRTVKSLPFDSRTLIPGLEHRYQPEDRPGATVYDPRRVPAAAGEGCPAIGPVLDQCSKGMYRFRQMLGDYTDTVPHYDGPTLRKMVGIKDYR